MSISNEKRFVLCMVLMVLWMLAWPYFARRMGLMPEPKKPPAEAVVAKDAEKKEEPAAKTEVVAEKPEPPKAQEPAKALAQAAEPPPKKPDVELIDESQLVLGSVNDHDPSGYRLEAWLIQKGAGIDVLLSSRFDDEFENGVAIKRPLKLIQRDTTWPPSLSLTLNTDADAALPAPPEGDDAAIVAAREAEDWLNSVTWEVVKDDQGRIRRPVSMIDPATLATVEGQAIVFRTKAPSGVIVTKTFRLGKNIDGLEVALEFGSPERERKVVYNLLGPHGIKIEGEWYTGTFRDLVFGQLNGNKVEVVTHAAYDIAKSGDKPIDNTALPLRFAGVENQYFGTLIEPDPPPTSQDDRWDSRALAIVHRNEKELQKSDVAVRITSRPIAVGPNQSVVHTYRIFAGPKMAEVLRPYGAEELASYRKNQWIPFAPYLARAVITPTLAFTYEVTVRVARVFGGTRGNYGIAIILLTILVRALMFPLGRKQALAAKKMQELQPLLKEIQQKYKDDKEKQTKETFALYKKHGVNPVGGCLPALIQLPIFVGLWQALNTSVALRHATFLEFGRFTWIRDLAAPDMLFRFPFEIPFLGWWFNVLPLVVVALMLVQTKLFSPPATTPEAESQQKMMKYMMIFMGVMFYKVPSGLGLYFITSSLWAIGERLLLPKVTHAHATAPEVSDGEAGEEKAAGLRGGKGGPNGNGAPPKAKPPGRIAQFWERLLEEARKDPTYRKVTEEREDKGRERDKGDPRARPRRR
jgi:YidC/Oxa1 family membrane protein insertase